MHRRSASSRAHIFQISLPFLRATNTERIPAHQIEGGSIKNDFTMGNNIYPKNHPQTLHLLDKYSKIDVPKISASEGLLIAQGDANKRKVGRVGDIKRGWYK